MYRMVTGEASGCSGLPVSEFPEDFNMNILNLLLQEDYLFFPKHDLFCLFLDLLDMEVLRKINSAIDPYLPTSTP